MLDFRRAANRFRFRKPFQVNFSRNLAYTLCVPSMNHSRAHHEIEIRHCATLAEYDECVRIEHLIWGEDIAVPSAIFVVAHHTGGQVLGAFASAAPSGKSRMVGFTLALAAIRSGKPYLHSHMTAVLPEFRDRGVGRRLKLFQRQDALKRGIDLIEWTFDPLELKNAHFNLALLGAVARRFIPDCYGVTESPLHRGLANRSPGCGVVAQFRAREVDSRGQFAPGRRLCRAHFDSAEFGRNQSARCRGCGWAFRQRRARNFKNYLREDT